MLKKRVNEIIMAVLFGVVVIAGSVLFIREPTRPKWPLDRLGSRMAEPNSKYAQLWVQPDVFMKTQSQGNILLNASDGGAFILGSVDPSQKESLIRLDLQSGEVDWVAFYNRWIFGPELSTMAINSNFVFVGFDGGQKISGDSTWGASEIVAYDISTGVQIWDNRIGGARSISTIAVIGSGLSIDGNYSSNYYLLDEMSGEVIEAIEIVNGFELLSSGEVAYKRLLNSDLQAKNIQTNTVLWEQKLPDALVQPPIILNNIFLVRTGNNLGQVLGLDQTTGEILWKYRNVASNIAVNDEAVFFLGKDAQLLEVDPNTGETLSTLTFSPNQLQDVSNDGFYVAVSDDILLIYFGDSRELFAFRSLRTE